MGESPPKETTYCLSSEDSRICESIISFPSTFSPYGHAGDDNGRIPFHNKVVTAFAIDKPPKKPQLESYCLCKLLFIQAQLPTCLQFASWGGRTPKRPVEDIAFAVARFFQRGGSFHNYYMV
ncbi:hypothetical protein CK203_082634 [Vitis vinifera]|uniref:Uncharacterized protein n=1 Tax=Vitis vinifera TaxID=29760 RepID=A0A438BWL2_VITVI|nr:hypothetical protein CK203_082634 [Vitis vinifera]